MTTITNEIRELSADEIGAVSGGIAPLVAAFGAGMLFASLITKVTIEAQKPGTAVKDAATTVINTPRPK